MRSAILFAILAIVALSLAEEKVEPTKEVEKNDTEQRKEPEKKDTEQKEPEKKDTEQKESEEKYTDRFDSLDVDELIANRRLLVPYIKCVLERGRCTPEGKELKVHVQDALQSACKKCTDKQKTGARRVVNHIKETEPIYWEELTTKFDPKGEFKPVYEAFLAGKDA